MGLSIMRESEGWWEFCALADAGRHEEALTLLTRLAEADDPHAQDRLARMYASGDRVPQDPWQSQYWLDRLTALGEGGHLIAQLVLYDKFLHRSPRAEDCARAAYWLLKAAEAGDAEAQLEIWTEAARVVFPGPQDEAKKKAQPWLEKSAAQGFAEAIWVLSWQYFTPAGEPTETALAMITKIAAQGHTQARRYLARLKTGMPPSEKMPVRTRRFAGTSAACREASDLWSANRRPEAVALLMAQAEADDPEAQAALVDLYARGGDPLPQDLEQSRRWTNRLVKLADAGNVTAQRVLFGESLKRPESVDLDRGVQWLLKAAEAGDPAAQLDVWAHAAIVFPGPPAQVHRAARAWLKKSAAQGHAEAMWILAWQQFTRAGEPTAAALELIAKAAAQNFPPASAFCSTERMRGF